MLTKRCPLTPPTPASPPHPHPPTFPAPTASKPPPPPNHIHSKLSDRSLCSALRFCREVGMEMILVEKFQSYFPPQTSRSDVQRRTSNEAAEAGSHTRRLRGACWSPAPPAPPLVEAFFPLSLSSFSFDTRATHLPFISVSASSPQACFHLE